VNAIREGRIVFENVKKTSYFLLTTNFASTSVLIAALLLGFPIPLTAVMILFVNLVTDGVMDIALATEPGHGDIMSQSPVKKGANILHWDIVPFLLLMAAIMVTLAILVFDYYLPQGTDLARTGTFLVVAMTQIFNVFNMRHLKKSALEIGILSNKWINIAFIASISLQIIVIKIPFLRDIFGFADISLIDFAVIFSISSLVLWGGELYKYVKFRKKLL
jgi:Ca2+-transporting ATPase